MKLADVDKIKEKLKARYDYVVDDEFIKGWNLGIMVGIDLINDAPTVNAEKWTNFAKFVAEWVVNDNFFEENADIFAELACRKLVKLGLAKIDGDTYKLKEE